MATDEQIFQRNRQVVNRIGSILLEHLLFAVAVSFVIPPVSSMAGQVYYFHRGGLLFMLAFLIASRYLAIRRGEETWFGCLLKCCILVVAGFVNFIRVFRY